MQIGPLLITTRPVPPVQVILPPTDPSPSPDLFALVAALTEWRDARQPCLEGQWEGDHSVEGKEARYRKWSRYSKAEAALMALARKLGERA